MADSGLEPGVDLAASPCEEQPAWGNGETCPHPANLLGPDCRGRHVRFFRALWASHLCSPNPWHLAGRLAKPPATVSSLSLQLTIPSNLKIVSEEGSEPQAVRQEDPALPRSWVTLSHRRLHGVVLRPPVLGERSPRLGMKH